MAKKLYNWKKLLIEREQNECRTESPSLGLIMVLTLIDGWSLGAHWVRLWKVEEALSECVNRDEVLRQGVLTPKCLRLMGMAKFSLVQDQGNDEVFHWSKYKWWPMID